jgi:2-oxoglutarate/2-oxoacid ferredoxin oxidoreductase subunit alpha
MREFSILIGGRAGDGIDRAGLIITNLLNTLGYNQYIYREYPSLIRGGHTFSITRASENRVQCHDDSVDVLMAMNKETAETHAWRLKAGAVVLYDPADLDPVDMDLPGNVISTPIPLAEIIAAAEAPPITRNSGMIGALAKSIGFEWPAVESVFKDKIPKALDKNLEVAKAAYSAANTVFQADNLERAGLPVITANETLGLGLIKGGLDTYIAYPMTPTSSILHFMANNAGRFGLKVMHPESEIGVILMALGCAYTGQRVAVGTSGGGFCLMTEGYSLAGMAELPVVIVLGQRPGPSTGLPTYSSQTDLMFALNAGQGEFTRFVAAPGDAEEYYYWAQIAQNAASKFRLPAILLTDKNAGEGTYSFDIAGVPKVPMEKSAPMLGQTGEVFKVNGYEHEMNGITTEDPAVTVLMQDHRLDKAEPLREYLENFSQVNVFGPPNAETALICWGSNKGVTVEAAVEFGFKVIQPIVMSPFPSAEFVMAMTGVKKTLIIENNATGQLKTLLKQHGFETGPLIAKYDGRAFSLSELKIAIKETLEGRDV